MFLLCLTFWDDGACSLVPEDLTCDLVWPHRLRVSGTKRHTVKKQDHIAGINEQLRRFQRRFLFTDVFKTSNIWSTWKKRLRLHCAVQIFILTLFRQWGHTESSKHIMFAPNCVLSVIIKPWGVVDGYFYCNMFHRRGCKQWHHPLHDSTRSVSKTSSAWKKTNKKVHSPTPETKIGDFSAILHNNQEKNHYQIKWTYSLK